MYKFLAEYLIFVLYSLVVLNELKKRSFKQLADLIVLAGLAWLLGNLVKQVFYLPRPTGSYLHDGSFPSVHAALAFVPVWYYWLVTKQKALWILFLAFGVAIGRVLVGVHTEFDVIAGAILAAIITLTLYHS
jgi:membrane-associated phospholipid phosphatase